MFKVKTEVEKENYAKFVIEPLEVGFGHTLGNSLRRVLLTSLEGAAITSVKIDGVSHQFSTIKGISEDAIEIILNLKKVRVKIFGDKPIRLILKAGGKKQVLAKDLDIEGDGEIANPDQPIATLNNAKAALKIEMSAEKGKGYISADDRKTDELGVIPVDSIFSPVLDVNYSVDPTRVGRRTNLDSLIVEIKTDGTITPKEALEQASSILSNTFKQIFEPSPDEEIEPIETERISEDVLNASVEELDLPVRITNALKAVEIEIISQLIEVPRIQLLKAKNLGAKSLSLISEKLSERGLTLREA